MARLQVAAVCALALALGCASQGFRHARSGWVARFGAPRHVLLDTVTVTGAPAPLRARLSYGRVWKDLEDEWVAFRIHWDGAWQPAGRALSDEEGLAELVIPASRLEAPGAHPVEITVEADGTTAQATVWVFEPGTPVAIFDIDGTLTAGGVGRRMLRGAPIESRPGAAEIVRRHAEADAQPIYLTGRSYAFARYTKRWLEEKGFVRGPLIVSPKTLSGFPWHDIADYKADWLARFLATVRPDIRVAYGDRESDACAYAQVGIPAARTFLWGEAAQGCEEADPPQRVLDYRSRLAAPDSAEPESARHRPAP